MTPVKVMPAALTLAQLDTVVRFDTSVPWAGGAATAAFAAGSCTAVWMATAAASPAIRTKTLPATLLRRLSRFTRGAYQRV